jgi:preprotein translocase subunit SecG
MEGAVLNAGTIIVSILQLLFSISIIVIVLLQSGKSAGLSGTIAGGAETFFGKSKGRTIDAMLGRYTSFASIAFLITSIILFVFMKNG